MRRIRMISAAVAVAIPLGAAVCGNVAVPSAKAQAITMSQTKAMSDPAKPNAAKPNARPGSAPKPVVGVNLYVNKNYTLAETKAWGARVMKYIVYTLKLKAVAIVWDYNVPNTYADVVRSSPTRTPTIADLAALTDIAKSYGLRVEYRVLFAINNKDSRSTSIQPKHFREWLYWLLFTEIPALRLAQEKHVSEFVVGTEMASIDQSPLWGTFFDNAAKVYSGILSYASYGGRGIPGSGGFFSGRRVALPIHDFGASAYPSIALSDDASVASLTRAWKNFLTRGTSGSVLRSTAIDEIGIPMVADAYIDPWQWDGITGPADPTIQARWFEAACNAVTAEHMRGIYFWSMTLNNDPAHPYPSLVGFEGRPASEAAIRSCV